jgi:hypothetical protein
MAHTACLVVNVSSVFEQLGFNLSNEVTDTLESSSILIYSKLHVGLYIQVIWRDAMLIKE